MRWGCHCPLVTLEVETERFDCPILGRFWWKSLKPYAVAMNAVQRIEQVHPGRPLPPHYPTNQPTNRVPVCASPQQQYYPRRLLDVSQRQAAAVLPFRFSPARPGCTGRTRWLARTFLQAAPPGSHRSTALLTVGVTMAYDDV
jgi:hypothetical protein